VKFHREVLRRPSGGASAAGAHLLSVGLWAAAGGRGPRCVALVLLIVTPAGGVGVVAGEAAALPRASAGRPAKTRCLLWILLVPTWVTLAVAEVLKPRMSTLALILSGPSAASVMPCGTPPAWARAVNVTSAEALKSSTVALLSPWMCMPCSVAVRLAS